MKRPYQEIEAENAAMKAAILVYLSEIDNPVPDVGYRKMLRDHLRKLVGTATGKPINDLSEG